MNRSPTLRISVSPDDHSHLIGKGGQPHKLLQTSTKTLVHFPERMSSAAAAPRFNWQAEDEVLLSPASAAMKTEPWVGEDQLVNQLANCREHIRQNQLLIYRLFVPTSSLDDCKVQELCKISHMAFKLKISLSTQQNSDCTIIAVRGTMRQSPAVIQVTTEVQKIVSCAVYNTLCLPSTHWRDLILVASNQVIKDFDLPNSTIPEAALASFLCTVGVMLQFHNEDMISIYGQDANHVLEVKQRLIQALPLGLILPISPSLSCNIKNSQLLASVQSLYGVRAGTTSNGAGTSSRIVLETYEANFAALFEARWLLSLQDPTSLLDRWMRMRCLWPADCSLPAGLCTPRTFAKLEESEPQTHGNSSLQSFFSPISYLSTENASLGLDFNTTFQLEDGSLHQFIGAEKTNDGSSFMTASGRNGEVDRDSAPDWESLQAAIKAQGEVYTCPN